MAGINILVGQAALVAAVDCPGAVSVFKQHGISVSKQMPYPHYPVHHWSNERFVFVVEGYFFEWPDWRKRIGDFAQAYFSDHFSETLLNAWFADTDAEFVVLIHDMADGHTIVFNDILGRLPLYFSKANGSTLVSRNVSFIQDVHGLAPDPQAFPQMLTLGFTLGDRTLYRGLVRIPGGSILHFFGDEVRRVRYHIFNFETLIDPSLQTDLPMQEIKFLFLDALKNRAAAGDFNLLALSGGLDSRAVAGGFYQSGLPFMVASFADAEGLAERDIRIAPTLAAQYGLSLFRIDLPPASAEDVEQMFELKRGVQAVDMAFLLYFYRWAAALSERPVLFTGDGGDKLLPDLRPRVLRKSPESIAGYAIRANAKMDPGIASRLLGNRQPDLLADVFALMESYPESDWNHKYIHFIMENRVGNWLLEGEDRNRSFLSSFTPFYQVRLFKKLMSIPPALKKDFALFDRFLCLLAPETRGIPNANWGFGIAEKSRIRKLYFRQDIKNTALGFALNQWRKGKDNYLKKMTDAEQSLFSALTRLPAIQQQIDLRFLQGLRYLDSDNLLHLITLMKILAAGSR